MIDKKEITRKLSARERLVCWLIMLMVRILAPWEYEHQFEEAIGQIVAILGEGE